MAVYNSRGRRDVCRGPFSGPDRATDLKRRLWARQRTGEAISILLRGRGPPQGRGGIACWFGSHRQAVGSPSLEHDCWGRQRRSGGIGQTRVTGPFFWPYCIYKMAFFFLSLSLISLSRLGLSVPRSPTKESVSSRGFNSDDRASAPTVTRKVSPLPSLHPSRPLLLENATACLHVGGAYPAVRV